MTNPQAPCQQVNLFPELEQDKSPQPFAQPHSVVIGSAIRIENDKYWLLFDELALFYSPDVESMVAMYHLDGMQVMWEKIEGPRIEGEFVFSNLRAMLQLRPTVETAVPHGSVHPSAG